MKFILIVFSLCSVIACQSTTVKQTKVGFTPEELGFSSKRLERIAPALEKYINEGKLAGIATLIAKNGKIVHLNVQGKQDIVSGTALSEESIFRIYSMTKPITTVAALTLWEQGKFHMQDPISKYLPEFKNMKVYISGSGDTIVTEDAKQPIRIIDLFMHTSGLSYGFSNSEVDKLYQKALAKSKATNSYELIADLAKLPLNHQPGTAWNYGFSTDVIGVLIEKLSGKKLGVYMQEHIFTPLNMQDTGFHVTADKAHRFSQVYTADKQGKTILMGNEPLGDFLKNPNIHNGGGGLTSTIGNYYTFAQMLLNGGHLNGVRILGRKTVEYMRTNHMPKHLLPYSKNARGEGYGLAMSVTMDPNKLGFMSSKGNYGWSGMASTYFRIDPIENIIIISMAQFIPIGFHAYHDDFRNLAYQALIH